MRQQYRLYLRGKTYYCHDHITGQQESLRTKDKEEAKRILNAKNDSVSVWFTDPPYYDAVPYAELSDFFYVWLKRVLPGHILLRDPNDPTNLLTPKTAELVQDETKQFAGKPKDQGFFERGMSEAFHQG